MPGLDTLQRTLELRPDVPVTSEVVPVDTSKKSPLRTYLAQSKEPSLALIRARHVHDASHMWPNLSGEDLFELRGRFEQYKLGLSAQMTQLAPIESMLYDFGDELGRLSSSLQLLQEQLSQLSSNLVSQKTTTEQLNPVILDLMVPPAIVKSIMKTPVTPEWIENIRVLNEKQALVDSVHSGRSNMAEKYAGSRAFLDLEAELQLLTAKCVERIRDFTIGKIKLLRLSVAAASSQTVQKDLLLVKDAYQFLRHHHPDLANELQLAYIYTMRWYYRTRFAKYIYAIEKLHTHHIDLSTVLGAGLGSDEKSDIFGLRNWVGKSTLQPRTINAPPRMTINEYLSSIEKRMQILDERTNPQKAARAIPSQIAETTPFVYWIEFVYHQWTIALVDNIVVEYLFMVDFFYNGEEKFEALSSLSSKEGDGKRDWSHYMFDDVFNMGTQFVQYLIQKQPLTLPRSMASTSTRAGYATTQGSCDAYGILLMIRLTQGEQSLLHNEFHIPVVDSYLNSVLLVLWPQFTKVVDLNCDAMKSLSMRTAGQKSSDSMLAPLPLSQQFAHFLLGLLKLASPAHIEGDFRGEPLSTSINRLKNDFESILTRISNNMFAGKRKGVEKEVFLFNNYFLVVNILRNEVETDSDDEKGLKGSDHGGGLKSENQFKEVIQENVRHFEMLCEAYKQH